MKNNHRITRLLIKLLLISIFLSHSIFLYAQDTLKFDIILRNNPIFSDSTMAKLDSVHVSPGKTYFFDSKNKAESNFTIPGLSVGKYRIFLSSDGFLISPLTVFVCSKCDKAIDFVAIPSKEKIENYFYDFVEIDPSYIGGTKALTNTFQNVLSRTEIQEIQKTPDLTVRFFVTKNKEVSDVTYSQDLSIETMKILSKAFNTLKNWEVGICNGKKTDGEFSLSPTFFNQL